MSYPVEFSVDYPDRTLNRLTTFFRLIVAIPILIVLGVVAGTSSWVVGGDWDSNDWSSSMSTQSGTSVDSGVAVIVITGTGLLVLPPLLMILFRRKYPRWWFDWNLELQRFMNRVNVYLSLMDDTYPSTDEHQSVRLNYVYPDAQRELNRWLPLVKWLLAIPHYVVLFFLWIASFVVVVIAWFAILFTGRYPRGMFDFVEGVMRWQNRVVAYAFLMVTDAYPPFRLAP